MTDHIPDEFIPDSPMIVKDFPVCPGCGREFDQATLEYIGVEYNGDTWHIECACEDHPEFEQDTPRYCPNCWAFSPWHQKGTPTTARICHGCGRRFKETSTKTEVLDETGGSL